MKKYLFPLLLLLSLSCGRVEDTRPRADILRDHILSCDTSKVLVVAHRGDWRYAPENSIEAIEHSIAVGVDVVEVDL